MVANHVLGRDQGFVPGTLEYCREQHIQIQAWSPLSRGLFTGADLSDETATTRAAADRVAALAEQLQVSREAIVLAWIMRHPVRVQPVIGTLNPERIRACAQAASQTLTREEWYGLLEAARGRVVP